jgi:hypothetical protein
MSATEPELVEWCRPRLVGYMRPRSISIISADRIPKNAARQNLPTTFLRNRLKKHCEPTLVSMDLRFAECTKWFAEFADIRGWQIN